jgi:hypothetical protein
LLHAVSYRDEWETRVFTLNEGIFVFTPRQTFAEFYPGTGMPKADKAGFFTQTKAVRMFLKRAG